MAAFNYDNIYDNFLNDGAFMHRAEVAGIIAAGDIYAESDAVTGHAERAAYATLVLNESASYAKRFAAVIVTDDAVVAAGVKNVPDEECLRAIKDAWNSLAGV
jgi:hypothetical protein